MKNKNTIAFDGKSMSWNEKFFFTDNRPFAMINGEKTFAEFAESSGDTVCSLVFPGTALEWEWQIKTAPQRIIVESRLVNRSDTPLQLGLLAWINTGDLSLFSGEYGSVFLHMPQELCLDKEKSDICYTARNRNGTSGDLILRAPLYFSEPQIKKELYFVPIKGYGDDRFM